MTPLLRSFNVDDGAKICKNNYITAKHGHFLLFRTASILLAAMPATMLATQE